LGDNVHISAKLALRHSAPIALTTSPHNIATGPPEGNTILRDAAIAVHDYDRMTSDALPFIKFVLLAHVKDSESKPNDTEEGELSLHSTLFISNISRYTGRRSWYNRVSCDFFAVWLHVRENLGRD
jgi:hypothetical protein